MNTKYLLNGLKLSEKEQKYLEKKTGKIEKFFKNCKDPKALRLEIDLKQDKKSFWIVEIMVKTPKKLFRVTKTDKKFTPAVDLAVDALMTQLRRHKDKMVSQTRRSS